MKKPGVIMIVEDDPTYRTLVSEVLTLAGYSTAPCESGEEALRPSDEPILALLDVNLGSMSGYEVARGLRDRFGEDLPIIFMSGWRTEPHDRVAGFLLGADDYLTKPLFPGELVARVKRVLDGRDLARATKATDDHARALTSGEKGSLTPREKQILDLLAAGKRQHAIATELFVSPKTVATHIQRILTKLGTHSRAEAVAVAYRRGLVQGATADGNGRHSDAQAQRRDSDPSDLPTAVSPSRPSARPRSR